MAHKIQDLYDYLIQFKDCENDEVLWRLARAATDKGKASTDQEVKRSCMYEAFEYAKEALQRNENNFACHKVLALRKSHLLYNEDVMIQILTTRLGSMPSNIS